MEDFKNQVTAISSNIRNLESNLAALEDRIQKKLISVLDISQENQMVREISAIEHIFKETSERIKKDLQEMDHQNKCLNQTTQEILFAETRRNHWYALTMKLKKVCAQYTSIQANYRVKEEQRLVSQYLIENPEQSVDEIQERLRLDRDTKSYDHAQNKECALAQARHKEIRRITQTIDHLCKFMDDLHDMVQRQRGTLDRIEVKITGSLDTTTRAKRNLLTACKYQLRKTKILKFFVYILIMLISFVLLYVICKYRPFGEPPRNFTYDPQYFR